MNGYAIFAGLVALGVIAAVVMHAQRPKILIVHVRDQGHNMYRVICPCGWRMTGAPYEFVLNAAEVHNKLSHEFSHRIIEPKD